MGAMECLADRNRERAGEITLNCLQKAGTDCVPKLYKQLFNTRMKNNKETNTESEREWEGGAITWGSRRSVPEEEKKMFQLLLSSALTDSKAFPKETLKKKCVVDVFRLTRG